MLCWYSLRHYRCGMQGDMEKAAGLPVSALMDRSMKGGMTRSQVTNRKRQLDTMQALRKGSLV